MEDFDPSRFKQKLHEITDTAITKHPQVPDQSVVQDRDMLQEAFNAKPKPVTQALSAIDKLAGEYTTFGPQDWR